MIRSKARFCWLAMLVLPLTIAHAQSPQQFIQQIVDTERTTNQNDHSQWIYLDHSVKPKEQLLRWVGTTPHGNVDRILVKDGHELAEPEQQTSIQKFLQDPHAQKKQMTENAHDYQQVDDLLRLLPAGFIWTILRTTPEETTLHFVPNPGFHPPTHEARVFAAATGELVADNHQHRIRSVHGTLVHDVTFGGGLLGRLKQGGSFAIEQQQVAPSLWQLTLIHIHLDGNALLFKSISFQEDDDRSRFTQQPGTPTLDQAAAAVLHQPGSAQAQSASR
jgi:phosphoglycolate phosphatase-like HAD superfamily hydrolase